MESMIPGFVFPNETGTTWSLMIVLYPYITGLVAGAFIVSSLYHVGKVEALRPLAKFALVAAFCFCSFATLPLLFHLHQPQRALNIMVTPHFTSAMSGFGFIYSFYLLLLAVEIWLVFRPEIVAGANSNLPSRFLYKLLALGVTDMTPRAKVLDDKLIHFLAVLGIPAACVLHGYVGFIFGAIKANPWWSTALMPVIFLMSAIVSGLAMLTLLYLIISWWRKVPTSHECVQSMAHYLGIFLVVAIALEGLEILNMGYEAEEEWHIISLLLTEKLKVSFLLVQIMLGSGVSLLLLALANWVTLKPRALRWVAGIASALVLVQVFAMRWNVVIGGQAFSKSFRGFHDAHIEMMGREGILATVFILCLPFALLAVMSTLFPLWEAEPVPSKTEG